MRIEKNFELLEDIKNVGVILRPQSPELKEIFFDIKKQFLNVGIETILEEESAKMIACEGLDFDSLCKKSDFLISVGGDGTLLGVSRKAFAYDKAVLGINLGTLGFLTDLSMEHLPNFIKDLKNNIYKINGRMMIEGNVDDKHFIAFNDIVISRKNISSMLKIKAKIDNKAFNTYFGDGVIVSTPTGSTAYNLSVGGPIVYPLTEAFIITPIAPHSLTQRPLVMPAEIEIEFKLAQEGEQAVVIVDGQEIYELHEHQSLKIKIAAKKARMLNRIQRDFFEVLNEKLRWGN